VWVQGKGLGLAQYARWSLESSRLWPQLRDSLLEETGVDVQLNQRGGYHICLNEQEVKTRIKRLQWLQDHVGADDYPFQILNPADVRDDLPGLGPEVAAVSYTPMDGHVNPLKLFHALHVANQQRGVRYMPCTPAAVQVFQAAGVLFAPGKAANAGGVATSGLEMSQNAQRLCWTREEVDAKLHAIMRDIHENCVRHASKGKVVNYLDGANIAGFVKVADAMLQQGIY